jgi:hypothetical protein
MKKDDYLSTTMQVPPKQRVKIVPFDPKTQREAFTVSLEGLKGVRFSFHLHHAYFMNRSFFYAWLLLSVES